MPTAPHPPSDVLCVGLITVDHVCAPLKQLPAAGGLEMTDCIEPCVGGCAANVAVNLSRVGRRASIACRVGNEVLGSFAAQVLIDKGVDCDQLRFSKTSRTATTMVVNVRGEDRRFIHDAGANAELTGEEVPLDAIRQSRVLYVGGFGLNAALSGENVARLFAAARETGVLTVLDVVVGEEDVGAMLEPVLPYTDLFFPNEDESLAITGLSEPVRQGERFRQLGAQRVIITRGTRGTVLVDDKQCFQMAAHAVEQVDATGGGDAFVTGYLHAFLDGLEPEDCVRYGSALGASCVRAAGATSGVFGAEELEAFVRDHPLKITSIS